jgi:hypothetical protein
MDENGTLRPAVLNLLKSYTMQVGPFAKVIMKQEMEKIGVSSTTIRADQWEVLCDKLAKKIPDYNQRTTFQNEAKSILDAA